MKEPISHILAKRRAVDDSFLRQLSLSLGLHGVGVIALVVGSGSWLTSSSPNERVAMTIRLGGVQGPGEGGLTSLGGQAIQEVIPVEEAARPQWVQPPADTAPDVVIPSDRAPRLEPRSEVDRAPEEARGRQLTRGARLQDGTTMADTGVSGIGLGLSTGGLGGTATEIALGDFCCPNYLSTMISLIRQRWDPAQRATGFTIVRFTVATDGAIHDVGIDRSSGYLALDQSARRAVLLTAQLPRLPSAFPESSLTVRLTFEYQPSS